MSNRDYTREELERQSQAAAFLLQEIQSDDEALNHDTVEGETGLFEAVEIALNEIAECEIMVEGLGAYIGKMAERKRRAEERAGRLRGYIDQAFQTAGVKTHKFSSATITTKLVPPKLVVSDESQIPSDFFLPQPPKLDKSALLRALKDGADFSGASLSNGGQTIQIRRA